MANALAISQKGVTELVRGIKEGMSASEYPAIRIEDFANKNYISEKMKKILNT